jgi:hypothetical protein
MPSRVFGAALAVLVIAGSVCAQPVTPPTLPSDIPPASCPPSDDGLFTGSPAYEAYTTTVDSQYYRWWITGEYFLAKYRPANLPVLATTGTAGSQGILGRDGTQILFGGGEQDFGAISGGRFNGGLWLDPCQAFAFEWGVFFLPRQRNSVAVNATAGVLARPFFDSVLNVENARLVSSPGLFDGTLSADFSSLFWGAELGSAVRVLEVPTFSFEQLFHFKYYNLEEKLTIADTSRSVGGTAFFNGAPQPAGTIVSVRDFYSTINRWYGGSGGLRLNWTPGRWAVSWDGRLGVGAVQRKVTVDGSTVASGVGATRSTGPGLLTAGATTGVFNEYRFSLAPEMNVRVAYHLTDHIAITAGYQFLYITKVARPGDQVYRSVNPGFVPSGQNFGAAGGPALRPFAIRESDFWLHGFGVGLMLKF